MSDAIKFKVFGSIGLAVILLVTFIIWGKAYHARKWRHVEENCATVAEVLCTYKLCRFRSNDDQVETVRGPVLVGETICWRGWRKYSVGGETLMIIRRTTR